MPLRLWPPTSPWTCQVTLQCLTLAWPELQSSVSRMPVAVTLSRGHAFHLADAQPDPRLALPPLIPDFHWPLASKQPLQPRSPLTIKSVALSLSLPTLLAVAVLVLGSQTRPCPQPAPSPKPPVKAPSPAHTLPAFHSRADRVSVGCVGHKGPIRENQPPGGLRQGEVGLFEKHVSVVQRPFPLINSVSFTFCLVSGNSFPTRVRPRP